MANTFVVGDKVRTTIGSKVSMQRLNGKVKYIACQLATQAGGRACDRKTCTHAIKDYIWVIWPMQTTTVSYHHSELEYEAGYKARAPTTLPAAKDMPKPAITEKDKDMDAFKKKVSTIMEPSKAGAFDWDKYHGYVGSKFRRGHLIDDDTERKPLQNDEIDWDVYRGTKRGSLRKQSLG
jgi:hypothetical protein